MTDLSVNVSKTIQAPIESVFDAWLNPSILSKFILPAPGMPEPQVELDAKEGGSFTILMQVGQEKIAHTGQYLELSRPTKLVFSWNSPFSADGSTVILNFTAIDEETTLVELNQVKFLDEQARTNHENGWGIILSKLEGLFMKIATTN